MPCGVLPVHKIETENVDYFEPEKSSTFNKMTDCCKGVKGLPLAIALAGLPYQDEAVLSLMGEIERLMNLKSFIKP